MPKILLVDDSRVMRRMLRSAVLETGLGEFTFIEADDGKQALQALEREAFSVDLVFCDLCMPEMDGLQFLEALGTKERLASCPVIVLTADARESRAQEALARGARRLISKPFTVETLSEALEEVLHPAS